MEIGNGNFCIHWGTRAYVCFVNKQNMTRNINLKTIFYGPRIIWLEVDIIEDTFIRKEERFYSSSMNINYTILCGQTHRDIAILTYFNWFHYILDMCELCKCHLYTKYLDHNDYHISCTIWLDIYIINHDVWTIFIIHQHTCRWLQLIAVPKSWWNNDDNNNINIENNVRSAIATRDDRSDNKTHWYIENVFSQSRFSK